MFSFRDYTNEEKVMNESELKEKILQKLKEGERTLDELAGELGLSGRDKWTLRRILSSLIKEGKIKKEPDYSKRRHVFKLADN
jgi:predicted ArsR family transcriptional regulator